MSYIKPIKEGRGSGVCLRVRSGGSSDLALRLLDNHEIGARVSCIEQRQREFINK
jgi:hypothetical protein